MMKFELNKENIIFGLSLFFAVWFMFTSSIWNDFSMLFISYPFGLISFLLLIAGYIIDPEKWRYTLVQLILLVGILLPMIVLLFK